MDVKQYMIVDLERRGSKQMFITEQVSSISKYRNGLWAVRFSSSSRVFYYNKSRLLFLTHPKSINLDNKGVYIKNKHIENAICLLYFSNGRHAYYHVTYSTGYYDNIEGNDIYITRTPIDENEGSIWEYLLKLAAETGLVTESNDNILSKQYELVDVKRDNIPLAQYVGNNSKLKTYKIPKQVYFPFGCNASQKTAVEAALTHQVSVIQGPPGTGKTQTILNIIANLLLKGKTVLIVSNNNSAVDNVAEKLEKEGLDFIVAKLGSVENKEAFIANQPTYPVMDTWGIDDNTTAKQAADALNVVTQGFDGQTRQAILKAEYNALIKETKYNELHSPDNVEKEWLRKVSSAKIMRTLNEYRRIIEHNKKPGWWFKLRSMLTLGAHSFSFLSQEPTFVLDSLETAYYHSRKTEIEDELEGINTLLQSIDLQEQVKSLRTSSLQLLKSYIAKVYSSKTRASFSIRDIKTRSEQFLQEYPVVLSTTYSAKSCISKNLVFDYVIMDEASQVDIKTGALTLSCAMNAVIVGDDKQLPNVVSQEEAKALRAIQDFYHIDDLYNAATHSFLQSCVKVFKDAPITLLREHYRCHPKIIEFCNQRFYNGELIAMTEDNAEKDVLKVIRTPKGNHARGHFNQREIDVITNEVLPQYTNQGSIGIIAPYRLQAEELNKTLGKDIASTVHKYQGRECDTIIMSMVDNNPTEFSDDANLLNVAISRAKTQLCIVANGNEMPQDSIIGQLISYVQYNNFEIKESALHSVFDLLYKQYTAERLAYESSHHAVSDHLSENLVYELLVKAIADLHLINTEVICHYPLSRLIGDKGLLNNEEKGFAESPLSHVDFLIYNSLTKHPLLTIEVDGWHFHKNSEVQQNRDKLKDHILEKYHIRPHRILTTDTINVETIKQILKQTI